MGIDDLLETLDAGRTIVAGSDEHHLMQEVTQQALRITGELNSGYQDPTHIRDLLTRLTGTWVPYSVTVFPPFTADFGRNLRLGRNVLINAGARFQDQGGIRIGDDTLIGHNATLVTLNHHLDPSRRGDMIPAPITIGRQVWLGADVTVLPGVTIGDGAVVGASSLVTRNVPSRTLVMGSPARVVRDLLEDM